ncbi:MAG: hypothetical protein G01um101466_732 [Parcubacteria group bacterium Gr01-1014_66]|nr:MAG: hypothetical protein G01um101466_732 [Parcubacteria group bacterium Gr01-1014_66]
MSESSFDYFSEIKERVPCNACGERKAVILARRSKNNLPVITNLCPRCGLIYISPRMTQAGYARYYDFFYRADRSAIKGKKEDGEHLNFARAAQFGRALARGLHNFFLPGLVIDVGSSTGGVLNGVREEIPGVELLGIEPSKAESSFAISRGIRTIQGLFEDVRSQELPRAGTILCVQTFNHLLDPRSFLYWAFDHLESDGHLVLAVKNFRHQVRRAGRIDAGVQIDHPFMCTPEVLKRFVESAGFKMVYLDVDEGKSASALMRQKQEGLSIHHIRLVAARAHDIRNETVMIPLSWWERARMRFSFHPVIVYINYLFLYSYRTRLIRRLFHV